MVPLLESNLLPPARIKVYQYIYSRSEMASYLSPRPLSRLSLLSRATSKARFEAPASAVIRRNAPCDAHGSRSRSTLSPTARLRQSSTAIQPIYPPFRIVPLQQRRSYAELKPSGGKTEADLIVEELQELYVFLCLPVYNYNVIFFSRVKREIGSLH